MAGSTYGTLFRITTWGESHGPAIGVVIDGCPSGLSLSEEDIQNTSSTEGNLARVNLQRREMKATLPRFSPVFSRVRQPAHQSLSLSTIQDQRSRDYGKIKDCYRPGHADYTFDAKYGIRDYRGGGRSSARETIGRVAAGAIAKKILEQLGIDLIAFTRSIGDICIPETEYRYEDIAENMLYMPNNAYAKKASDYLESCMKNQGILPVELMES